MLVYKITNIVNDRPYFGSTKDFNQRKKTHLEALFNKTHHNKYLQKDFDIYGATSFKFEILKYFEKEQEMLVYEYQMINSTPKVYNILKVDFTQPLIKTNKKVKVINTKGGIIIQTKRPYAEIKGLNKKKKLNKKKNDNCYAKKQAKRIDDSEKKAYKKRPKKE